MTEALERRLGRAAGLSLLIHLVAGLAMICVLRRGLDTNPDLADRLRFLVEHRALWLAGWAAWNLAALSILYFCRAFALAHQDDPSAEKGWLRAAFPLALLAVAGDLSAEFIEMRVLPGLAREALSAWRGGTPLAAAAAEFLIRHRGAVLLTGSLANGLYTLMAVLMAWACRRAYPRETAAAAALVGISGAGLSLAALTGSAGGMFWANALLVPAILAWQGGVAVTAFRRANALRPRQRRPLVVYDGECGICAGNLPWLGRLDWLEVFDALPYQSEETYRRVPALRRSECEQALQLALPDGKIFSGADAFREVFLRMPALWPAGVLMAAPPVAALLRRLYPILARNRYRLGGHCEIKRQP